MSLAPSRRRSLLFVLSGVLLAVGLAGCADDGGTIAVNGTRAVTTTAAEASTTSAASGGPTSTSVAPDAASTTTGSGGDVGGNGSSVAADEDATDNSWSASAGEYRGRDGLHVAYDCPAGGTLSQIWGIGPFTDDSSVCTAAVYAGMITVEGGGRVVIEIVPGADVYAGGVAHGVTADDYGVWAGSFSLVR